MVSFGPAIRWVWFSVSVLLGMLVATIDFDLATVCVFMWIGVISTALDLTKVLVLTLAWRPFMLLQP